MKLLTLNEIYEILEKKFFSLDLDHTKTVENLAMQRFDILSLTKIINSTTEFRK